jgi:hypothetical protein
LLASLASLVLSPSFSFLPLLFVISQFQPNSTLADPGHNARGGPNPGQLPWLDFKDSALQPSTPRESFVIEIQSAFARTRECRVYP